MSLSTSDVSIVHWFAGVEKHTCGYCKQKDCSVSHGMWAETMTVEDYQNLIDRGWRRSGKYCYKPIMNETCCPQYTIRCDVLSFKVSKSQRKVIKKFNKFLSDGIFTREAATDSVYFNSIEPTNIVLKERPNFAIDFTKLNDQILESTADELVIVDDTASGSQKVTKDVNVEETVSKKFKTSDNEVGGQANRVKKGSGPDPSKPPCKKAKLLRLEKRQKKLQEKGATLVKKHAGNEAKTLEQLLSEIPDNSKHKLKMKLICVSKPSNELAVNLDTEYSVYRKYQMTVHNDPPERCTRQGFVRFLVNTPLKIRLVRMHSKHKLFKLSAQLFAKYQMAVHNEQSCACGEQQFFEFLVDTPFQAEVEEDDDDGIGFGSFHQQYWIGDELIAVGVIDILPRCTSSVYFFYDPDYRSLTLGTYGSLREVEFTQSLLEKYPTIKHYYMGFYIHSCPKMRYKGNLHPSDLLCPETYCWLPIGDCVPKLDACKYARLNEDVTAVDDEACSKEDVDMIKILLGYKFTILRHYKYRQRERNVFEDIGKFIGKRCAGSLLFVSQKQ